MERKRETSGRPYDFAPEKAHCKEKENFSCLSRNSVLYSISIKGSSLARFAFPAFVITAFARTPPFKSLLAVRGKQDFYCTMLFLCNESLFSLHRRRRRKNGKTLDKEKRRTFCPAGKRRAGAGRRRSGGTAGKIRRKQAEGREAERASASICGAVRGFACRDTDCGGCDFCRNGRLGRHGCHHRGADTERHTGYGTAF